MQIPGIVWVVVLVGLPALSVWLETYFSGAVWAAPVAALLLIVVKVVSVWREQAPTTEAAAAPAPPRGKVSRILLG